MNINITNRNDKVSPAVREKIEAWLEESHKRYNIITSAQVTIEKNNGKEEVVEATIHAPAKTCLPRQVMRTCMPHWMH